MEPTLDESLLSAYLDGELSPPDRQQLEQRLANEPELRQRLTLLEETWQCLDLLEQESVDSEQIETTLKIAAVSVSAFPFAASKTSRFGRWSIAVLAGILVFIVTFQLGKQSPFDNPSFRQQIEWLDLYHAVLDEGGIELLRQLAEDRVFLPPLPVDLLPVEPHEYEPHLQGWLVNVFANTVASYHSEFDDAGLRQLLSRNIQTYNSLPPSRVKRIQQLHRDIEMAPQRTELLLTLQNFYRWFRSLQPYERNALRKWDLVEEKVAAIVELKTSLEWQPEDATMSSVIPGIVESKQLAETLAELAPWQRERLLNEDPIQIVNELKQSSSR